MRIGAALAALALLAPCVAAAQDWFELTVVDDVDGSPRLRRAPGETLLASGAAPEIVLPVGTHRVRLEVSLDDGIAGTDWVLVAVTAPVPPGDDDDSATPSGGCGRAHSDGGPGSALALPLPQISRARRASRRPRRR